MRFLGIDPGLHGAMALVDGSGSLEWVCDIPIVTVGEKQHKLEYNRAEIVRLLRWMKDGLNPPLIACIELVHAFPGQGVVSMWRQGQGFELWLTAWTVLEIPYETVTPQRWKGLLLDGLPKGKDASRQRAQALWPTRAASFSRTKDDGRAEAALIAEYLRRQWRGHDESSTARAGSESEPTCPINHPRDWSVDPRDRGACGSRVSRGSGSS